MFIDDNSDFHGGPNERVRRRTCVGERVPLDIYARRSSSSTIRSYMSFTASTSDLT